MALKKKIISIIAAFLAFAFVVGLCIAGSSLWTRRSTVKSSVYFSEIMTSNRSAYPDGKGEFYDWIELYNGGEEDADISGYGIGINSASPSWAIPSGTVIPQKGYIIIFCSGTVEPFDEKGRIHAPFKISKTGDDVLTLFTPDGQTTDTITTLPLTANEVMIRADFTKDSWEYSEMFTPGYDNTPEGKELFSASFPTVDDPIKINEIMAKNHLVIKDSFGNYSDWIEVVNTSNKPVNLKGYMLSDDGDNRYKWTFPSVILGGGEVLTVFCSGRNTVMKDEIHAGFNVPSSGGNVVLSRPDGCLIDRVSYDFIPENESYARLADGYFECTPFATPSYPNTDESFDKFAAEKDKNLTGLVISEIMVNNRGYCAHNGGRYYDWIELHNTSDKDINLKDYALSSKYGDLSEGKLPDKVVRAGGYCVIMCSGEEVLSTSLYPHVNFKIGNDGEEIFLSKKGEIVDAVYFKNIKTGFSYGRTDRGGFFYMASPSPAAQNGEGVRQITSAPSSDMKQGVYNDVDAVSVKLTASPNAQIFYTTDCKNPTIQSKKYTGEIKLRETTVIKAIAWEEGKLTSDIVNLTYVINEYHSVPVVSLSAEPTDLFDYYNGIYANGPGYTETFPHWGANFWKDIEKPGHISYFEEGEDGFSLDCGIKMFGNYGRGYPQKPFNIKFRKIYGQSELHYKLFDQYDDVSVFKSIVLRAGSQDGQFSKFRDELFTGLVGDGDTTVLVQAYQPCVLYLNGSYWGMYFIREKVDTDYLSQHRNVAPESFNLLVRNGQALEGDNSEYLKILNYVTSHDMRKDENYEYISSKVDIENYIDFKIAQAYSGNIDIHNQKYYISSEDDGKWRWIFYDQDFGFRTLTHSVDRTINDGFSAVSNTLIHELVKNDKFRDLYFRRFAMHLKTTYSQQTVLAKIDSLYNTCLPEMERHCALWGPDINAWKSEVEHLRNVARKDSPKDKSRIETVLEDLKYTFKLSDSEFDKYFGDIEP